MIENSKIYEGVTIDHASEVENGDLSIPGFNRISESAELKTLDWLTGSVIDSAPPAPYTTEKCRGWIAPFTIPKVYTVESGTIVVPDDFYMYETLVVLNDTLSQDCETKEVNQSGVPDTPIEVLDPQVFDDRCSTYVKRLRPTVLRPIAKRVGNNFEFAPKDIGSVKLVYFRYPKFAKIISKKDDLYNNDVIDESASTPYEWQLFAKDLLIWFIIDIYSNKVQDRTLKEFNAASGKTPKG